MRTLVISDLHLGTGSRADVLRRPAALDALVARLRDVDRLVLLGDVVELRHGPARDALAAAEPVLRALGDAVGEDGEIVLVPGNHDHALVAGWLDWRGRRAPPGPLALDERVEARRASWPAKRVAGWLGPADVEIAYPGVWLRDDVYATHGHYLDAHNPVPTFERLAAGTMARLAGRPPERATPDDYEAMLAPLYAWIHAAAQRAVPGRRAPGAGGASVRMWGMLEHAGGHAPLRVFAARRLFRAGVRTANRVGIGPVHADLGGPALRRGGLAAMGEVARRLGLAPAHLVFGHTHRTGMLPGDASQEWRTPSGTRLHNPGSWVFETHFMGPGQEAGTGPYWPGGAIALDETGPPRLERLLAGVPGAQLRPRPA